MFRESSEEKIMKSVIASLIAIAGMSAVANAQLMKMLVSTDGTTFTNSVSATPGQTVQVLVTVSYTGTSSAVTGFGSANFQPTISNWGSDLSLLPMRQGGNVLPAGGAGMIQPQFYAGTTAGDGPHVSAGYVAGSYGRVNPMGRTFLDDANAITSFVHNNPDGTGLTYLRIAQANVPMWFGQAGNTTGGSGVNVAQLYVVGRTTDDPDFWGNKEVNQVDPSDPSAGWAVTPVPNPAGNARRNNVEVFRFAFTVGTGGTDRFLTIDAPLAGQQETTAGSGVRYIGYWNNPAATNPGALLAPVVQTGSVHVVIPTPATLALMGLGGLVIARRRRA